MRTAEGVEVRLDDVTLYRRDQDWRDVVYREYADQAPLPNPGGGEREAALLVEVAVDGAYTCFYGQHVDRVILDRVLEDLQFLVEQLDRLYPKDQPRGRCLTFGDWGRCWERDGHEGDHRFPSAPQGYEEAGQ